MRRPWPVFALLAGALAFLVSLYLPWHEASCGPDCFSGRSGTVAGLLNLFSGTLSIDGWSSGLGDAAALFAFLLAAMAVLALARPSLVRVLPLGAGALLVGYFTLAVAAGARSVAQQREPALRELDIRYADFHYAYGAYLGIAAGVVVLGAAAAMRRNELKRIPSFSGLASIVLCLCLLVAFLLPWQQIELPPARLTVLGIADAAALVAAALTLWLLGLRWRADAEAWATGLVLAAAAALFTAAAFSSVAFPASRLLGAWIALGAALGLVALALSRRIGMRRLRLPLRHGAVAAAAALLVGGLFLPWQTVCYERAGDLGPYSGRCFSTGGWSSSLGAAAALLAIGLVIVTLAPRQSVSPAVLAAGIGLLIATFGFRLEDRSGGGVSLEPRYGSTIGFLAAGLLVALTLVRSRPRSLEWKRVLVRLVPVAACAAYLVVVVLPWWDVLPQRVQSALHVAPLSWLTIAAALLTLWLLQLWGEQIAIPAAGSPWLVLVPLALLALAAIDLVRLRDAGLMWGHGAVLGLCLVLLLLGRVEQRDGLESFRLPEILRIDRIR